MVEPHCDVVRIALDHNPNYFVAGRLIEVVSKQSFDAFLRQRIFMPLGMTNTRTVDVMDERRDGTTAGHVFAFGHAVAAPGPDVFINAAGGMISTARDMAAWLSTHTAYGVGPMGGRVLSEQSMRETLGLARPAHPLAWSLLHRLPQIGPG